MKQGYRILVHRDISKEDMPLVIKECQKWNPKSGIPISYGTGWITKRSWYRRGVVGKQVGFWANAPETSEVIVIRRLVKNKRIFGAIPLRLLETLEGGDVKFNDCKCGICNGGQKCRIKNGFVEDDYDLFCELGDIKG